jgi:hypothetical protein
LRNVEVLQLQRSLTATASTSLIRRPVHFSYSINIMSSKPVILILGSGPRVGAAVAKKFASTGYSVAITSRKATEGMSEEGYLSIKADLSSPSSIPAIFDAVKSEFHSAPSVIVYNAAAFSPPTGDDLFSIPVESLDADTVSAYAAAKEAVKGWASLTGDTKRVFIYTGNKLNTWIAPMLFTATLGIGKSATSYLIGSADARYAKDGYRLVKLRSYKLCYC